MPKKMLKIGLPIIILFCSIVIAWYLINSKSKKPPVKITERVWQVETIKALSGNYSPSVILYGIVEAPDLYNTSAPSFGRLLELHVKEGQKVSKGQLLAKMDEADFLPALKMAQAKVASFDAQINNEKLKYNRDKKALTQQQELLSLNKNSLKRTQGVYKNKLASQAELDEATKTVLQQQLTINTLQLSLEGYSSRLKNLQASREQALAEIDKAELSLNRATIYAPFDGIINEVKVAVGDQLSSGTNLFSLYPASQMEIRAKIPFQFKQRIEKAIAKGQTLYAYSANENQAEQKFKLLRLSGQETASGVDVFFQVEASNQSYRAGAFQQLRLVIPSSEDLFAVPYSALYGKDKLYKIEKDKDDNERMQSVIINPVGDYTDNSVKTDGSQNSNLLLFSSKDIVDNDQIVITHLPNALNGLKVKIVNNDSD